MPLWDHILASFMSSGKYVSQRASSDALFVTSIPGLLRPGSIPVHESEISSGPFSNDSQALSQIIR